MVLYLMVPSPHLFFNLLRLDPDLPQHQLSLIHFFFKDHSMMSSIYEVNMFVFVCVRVRALAGQPSCPEGSVASAVCAGLCGVSGGRSGVCPATEDSSCTPPTRYRHGDTHTHTRRVLVVEKFIFCD